MRKIAVFLWLAGLALFFACGNNGNSEQTGKEKELVKSYVAKGDSTLYGLVCDGGDDTHLVVFFPEKGLDPDTFDISEARMENKVFGFPTVGDKYALVVSPEDKKKVVLAINLHELMGTWVYKQLPHLREDINLDILNHVSSEEKARFDSIVDSLMIPREYGFTLKVDQQLVPTGMGRATKIMGKESPVVYPPVKRYTEWHIFNGDIILTYAVSGSDITKEAESRNDTAQLVYLRSDTMALRFGDVVQGYRLRPDTLNQNQK